MMTILLRAQVFASLPNSRLNTPMFPGPQTSCVIKMSAFTQRLSPACTLALPAARARIFSVNVIISPLTLAGTRDHCNRGNELASRDERLEKLIEFRESELVERA